jgi:cytochrome b6-f complex iron-sulfur subunit
MNRREFIGWVGVGAIASSLPVALAACSAQNSTAPTSTAPGGAARVDGFEAIGSLSALTQEGQLSQKIQNQPVVVLRDPQDAQKLLALNATCSHKGCAVAWKKEDKAFECPCHDAKFASDGKVLAGPATTPLQTYTAKIEGDQVLVKVG